MVHSSMVVSVNNHKNSVTGPPDALFDSKLGVLSLTYLLQLLALQEALYFIPFSQKKKSVRRRSQSVNKKNALIK